MNSVRCWRLCSTSLSLWSDIHHATLGGGGAVAARDHMRDSDGHSAAWHMLHITRTRWISGLAKCDGFKRNLTASANLMECLETFLVRLVYGMCDSLAKSIILATANSLVPLAKTGRPRVSHELLLDQFIRVLRTGTTWRDVKGIDFDKCRRLILRYDKTIVAYEGWTWLACCRLAGNQAVRN